MDRDTLNIIRRVNRRIKRAPLVALGPDQYADKCQWSRTGWAAWNKGGGCTCEPVEPPLPKSR